MGMEISNQRCIQYSYRCCSPCGSKHLLKWYLTPKIIPKSLSQRVFGSIGSICFIESSTEVGVKEQPVAQTYLPPLDRDRGKISGEGMIVHGLWCCICCMVNDGDNWRYDVSVDGWGPLGKSYAMKSEFFCTNCFCLPLGWWIKEQLLWVWDWPIDSIDAMLSRGFPC